MLLYQFFRMIDNSDLPIILYSMDEDGVEPITLYTPEDGWSRNVSKYFSLKIVINVFSDEISVFKV